MSVALRICHAYTKKKAQLAQDSFNANIEDDEKSDSANHEQNDKNEEEETEERSDEDFFIYFFIKCMQSMTMTLSKRCVYTKLHVTWSKLMLYIFSLSSHIDRMRIQAR